MKRRRYGLKRCSGDFYRDGCGGRMDVDEEEVILECVVAGSLIGILEE